jgi:hypothetical protein
MANFDVQIQNLVGETFTDNSTAQVAMDDWMTHGAREIINVLPPNLKEKCMTESTITNSPSYLADLDGIGEILHVTRLSADSGGFRVPCRQVPSMYGEMTGDSANIMYYATATDPAYWITSSSDATILNVNPTPTANQTAIVYHVGYPSIDASAVSTIANFPDEVEYLVVLFAAVKAAEFLLAAEEDDDLYVPIINTLRTDYLQGLQLLGVSGSAQQKKGSGAVSKKQLNKLMEQLAAAQQSV